MKHAINENALKGVSTLDIIKKSLNFLLFLIILTAFGTNIFGRGGHSTLDLVDPSFNPSVQSAQYGNKTVHKVQSLPNGKILALGNFTSYNRVPTGSLVRLNADGSLDPTFYTQTITSIDITFSAKIVLQSDGKIVVLGGNLTTSGQSPKHLLRLNADGTLDTGFNYTLGGFPADVFIDSIGRIALSGSLQTPQGARRLIRLNNNGSLDTFFNFVPDTGFDIDDIAVQDSRLLVYMYGNNTQKLYRLGDNGSPDTTFTAINLETGISDLTVQTDNKITYFATGDKIRRLNADGSVDNGFQPITPPPGFGIQSFKIADDGKIVVSVGGGTTTFYRFLSDGVFDSSFNPYTTTPQSYSRALTIQPDGGIIIGDKSNLDAVIPLNNFVRLLPENGMLDPAFNPGGIGFQIISPGSIRAIATQTDGKILLGGKFDLINDVSRYKLARLNADSTVDSSFQINTTTTGNYFSVIRDIYQIRVQSDGKVLVSGSFNYVINGVTKFNFVRLNSDGSIDGNFFLSEVIPDYSDSVDAGINRFLTLDGGKVMIGTSRISNIGVNGPLKFNNNGARDTSFDSMLNTQSSLMLIDDMAIQPDGKVLVTGTSNTPGTKTFIARLNSDGSLDSTFPYTEETGRIKSLLASLPNGKVLIAKHMNGNSTGTIRRLNSDGSVDTSFNTLFIPNAVINALLVLPNGKIFVGGRFMATFSGQLYENLLRLSADGTLEPTVYNVNKEVLCLAVDGEDRVLIGGAFTVIGANGDNAARSYVARLTDAAVRFDFDGDGRSDLSAFTSSNGKWTIQNSGSNQVINMFFGLNGDKLAAADYDGDGNSDIAVFRPSNGVWYLWRSREGFTAFQWGTAEDKPVAADYDGDGLADVAVWRPSNGGWYVRQSLNAQLFAVQFGQAGDIPLTGADFDGDGKADIAVWRPSNGVFYWLASGSNHQFRGVQFGLSGDIPVVGDFNGDGKTDLVVFRPSEGNWYQLLTQPNGNYSYSGYAFGMNGDEPVVADYDGDGKTDTAVRRGNIWHINRTSQGYMSVSFGDANDLAVPSSLIR